ncbi:MAG: hypothetical protein AVDCRST_MAG90-3033, partial [uncultured Microvirga sp.]
EAHGRLFAFQHRISNLFARLVWRGRHEGPVGQEPCGRLPGASRRTFTGASVVPAASGRRQGEARRHGL